MTSSRGSHSLQLQTREVGFKPFPLRSTRVARRTREMRSSQLRSYCLEALRELPGGPGSSLQRASTNGREFGHQHRLGVAGDDLTEPAKPACVGSAPAEPTSYFASSRTPSQMALSGQMTLPSFILSTFAIGESSL